MGLKVILGSLLACTVSSVPLDAGYGVPSAPLILSHPPLPAPLPLQLVHNAPTPLLHNHAQPIFHSVQQPFIHPVPAPLPFASEPIPLGPNGFGPEQIPFAPHGFAPEPFPFAPESLAFAPEPLRFAPEFIGPAPLEAPSSQFHAQDEFGQFSFGYENINSAKTETKDAFGVTRGTYQYVDANGLLQTVHYIADDVNGFRVAGTNIPTAPAALAAGLPVGPEPVLETPEVAAARADHLAAHAEAKAAVDAANAKDAAVERKKRSPEDDDEPTPEPESEPEPEAARKKREAKPIQADYKTPLAPLLVSAPVALPVATPLVHHTHPAPFRAPLHPAPQPFIGAPEAFALAHHAFAPEPFLPAPESLAFAPHGFAPEPIAFAPHGFAPEPIAFAPHGFAPEPFPFAPESLAFAPEPLRFAPEFIGPAPFPAPLEAPSSQFHAQDEFGQFSFGYENINSAKTETKDAFGVTRGTYQYVDANGLLQTVHYIADDINGFRVAGTNIPVAAAGLPVAPAAVPLVAPLPVAETPEVAAARAEHAKAHVKAKAAVAAANVVAAKEEEL